LGGVASERLKTAASSRRGKRFWIRDRALDGRTGDAGTASWAASQASA